MKKFNFTEEEIVALGSIFKKVNGEPRKVKIIPVENLQKEKLEIFLNYYYDKNEEDKIKRDKKGYKKAFVFTAWSTTKDNEEIPHQTIFERATKLKKAMQNKTTIKENKIVVDPNAEFLQVASEIEKESEEFLQQEINFEKGNNE